MRSNNPDLRTSYSRISTGYYVFGERPRFSF